MIPAETELDCNTEHDWKIQHTGLMTRLENWFNKEVHILIAKQPPTVEDNNSATTQMVASALRENVFPAVDHNVDFPSTYEVRWKNLIIHIIPQFQWTTALHVILQMKIWM